MKRNHLTIPNFLSFYRIMVFPLILWFIFQENESMFATFLIISLVTDVLDGWIARSFNLQSEFGARIDSVGDQGTYFLAFLGIYVFKWDVIAPHMEPFLLFVVLCVVLILLALLKFGKLPSFHLYSWKIGGYIQGFFFFTLFAFEFYPFFFYFMIIWANLAALEHIVIQLIIPRMRSNVKGLYWVLKERD